MLALTARLRRSVQFKFVLVVQLERWILLVFFEKAVADHEGFDLRSHKTPKRAVDVADDRFAANVKTGVDQNGTSGEFLKATEQRGNTGGLSPDGRSGRVPNNPRE